MNRYTIILLATGIFHFGASRAQSYDLKGVWTECIGIDSLKTIKCKNGYITYTVKKDRSFILNDSSYCPPNYYVTTGKWVFKNNDFTIFYDDYSNERCTGHHEPTRYLHATWLSKDLFYFIKIGELEWPGQRVFFVFRRLK